MVLTRRNFGLLTLTGLLEGCLLPPRRKIFLREEVDPYLVMQRHFLEGTRHTKDMVNQVRDGVRVDGDPASSLDVIRDLPYATIAEKLGLAERRRVGVLYPGAGTHAAMLEVGKGLHKAVSTLGSIDYVFTEVAMKDQIDASARRFEEYIGLVAPRFRVIAKKIEPQKQGVDITYSLNVSGIPMELKYAVNRSERESGDHEFFKREHADVSDIFVSHDSFSLREWEDLPDAIFTFAVWGARAGRQKAIIFEDTARIAEGKSGLEAYSGLPGEVLFVAGDYGCANRGYKGAVIYFPDNTQILALEEQKKLGEFLDALNGVYFEREKSLQREQKNPGPEQVYDF